MKSEVLILLFVILSVKLVEANFEDSRCRCTCPSTKYFAGPNSTDNKRRYYTKTNVLSSNCNPQNVVKVSVKGVVDSSHLDAFLANCDCRFESRNTILLKVVVIFVICVLALLGSYMLFLTILDPMFKRRKLSVTYKRQDDEIEDNIFGEPTVDTNGSIPLKVQQKAVSVLDKVEDKTSKWKSDVQEQRRKIDRVLNAYHNREKRARVTRDGKRKTMKVPFSETKSHEIATIMGQKRVNQLGGHYINGKPLPNSMRIAIVNMHNQGIKPCVISRQLKISHGAVSKILNRFNETGSVAPGQIGGNPRKRQIVQSVERQIFEFKEMNPSSSSLDIQQHLIHSGHCTRDTVPTVNSITRHLKSRGLIGHSRSPRECGTPISPTNSDKKLNHSIENILGIQNNSTESRYQLESPTSSNGSRSRTNFSQEQIDILERFYGKSSYPSAAEKEEVSRLTGLSQDKIGVWFSNRRARLRKTLTTSTMSPDPTSYFKFNPQLIQQFLQLQNPSFPTVFPTLPLYPIPKPLLFNGLQDPLYSS
ncbi:unnamed protein product [Bursaphelenchus xylophilus]|uniref:(pine wood nematode) hypothetical protein n=1 Tax=Bursaphelenchus xylophilus TaxID=6326 RepID=A0A1I7SVW1_BURXY|nr:unnamed protein product [Bursaphelenchus xylophilus]CAG9098378.1 unnamed protein product [Bursaphelenchus xylophilus]